MLKRIVLGLLFAAFPGVALAQGQGKLPAPQESTVLPV